MWINLTQSMFPGGTSGNQPENVGDIRDAGLIPGSGRSPGGGNTPVFLPGECPGTEEPGRL